MMRNMFLVAATFALTLAGASTTHAAARTQATAPTTYGGYAGYAANPNGKSYRYYRGGFFTRLLELERRKNEVLFGGLRR